MKSLYCLLITTLLAVTSYGAEKVLPSQHGLEGYGENGLHVFFQERFNPNPTRLITHAENILKKAGFKIDQASSDVIWIGVIPTKINGKVVSRTAHMDAYRDMEFTTKSGKRYRSSSIARAWDSMPTTLSEMEKIENIVGVFIGEWRKANPKK